MNIDKFLNKRIKNVCFLAGQNTGMGRFLSIKASLVYEIINYANIFYILKSIKYIVL